MELLMGSLADGVKRSVEDIFRARYGPLEEVVRYLVALGYDPATDMLLEIYRPNPANQQGELDRLLVCGKPVFEVAVSEIEMHGDKITIHYTPRLIEWPMPRGIT